MESTKPQYTHACDIAIQLDMPARMWPTVAQFLTKRRAYLTELA